MMSGRFVDRRRHGTSRGSHPALLEFRQVLPSRWPGFPTKRTSFAYGVLHKLLNCEPVCFSIPRYWMRPKRLRTRLLWWDALIGLESETQRKSWNGKILTSVPRLRQDSARARLIHRI